MTTFICSNNLQGNFALMPPIFNGCNYEFWKIRMRVYLQALDYYLWEIISEGYVEPTVEVDGAMVPKPRSEWSEVDKKRFSLNAMAIHLLYCGLDENEFIQVSTCKTAHEIWKMLEVIHEGTNQLREFKKDRLVQKYELFKMEPDESIKDMYTRFIQIVNSLKFLGKSYGNVELVRKILRSLPKAWATKVTAVEERNDLHLHTVEDLISSLMTYEHKLVREKDDSRKNKSLELESFMPGDDEDSDMALIIQKFIKFIEGKRELKRQSSGDDRKDNTKDKKVVECPLLKSTKATWDDDDDDMALIIQKFINFLEGKREFTRQSSGDDKKDKTIDEKKKDIVVCTECKKPGHGKIECPLLKSIKATWYDNDKKNKTIDEKKKDIVVCNECNKSGHRNIECPLRKNIKVTWNDGEEGSYVSEEVSSEEESSEDEEDCLRQKTRYLKK